MIVPEPVARALVEGRATQVTVPRRGGSCPYRRGHDYAIQPHTVTRYHPDDDPSEVFEIREVLPAVGRVQILDVRRGSLDELRMDDVRREGIRAGDWWAQYVALWRLHRGPVGDFVPVWTLSVKPHADVVRLLAPSGAMARGQDRFPGDRGGEHHDDEHDYTASRFLALGGEDVPVVDPAELHPDWAAGAAVRRLKLEQERTLDAALARELERARVLGVDVSAQVRSIEQRVAALRRRLDQQSRRAA